MRTSLRLALYFMAAAVVMGGGILYACYDPGSSVYFPKCPFYFLTGLKCPGCGSQRAVHSLLHLDIAQAFSYNALLVLSLPILLLLGYAELARKKNPLFYRKIHRPVFIWSYFVIVVAWGICRNIFNV